MQTPVTGCTFVFTYQGLNAAELVGVSEYKAAFDALVEGSRKGFFIDRQGTDRETRYSPAVTQLIYLPVGPYQFGLLTASFSTMVPGAVMGVPSGDKRDFDFAKNA